MNFFTTFVFIATIASCSADISLKLRENDFSTSNEQGGYHFGYNDGHVARQEERSPEGVVRGAYRYIDANGETQTVTYTADDYNGFVASGTNIPKIGRIPLPDPNGDVIEEAPAAGVYIQETPEVRAATVAHLEAYNQALRGLNTVPQLSFGKFLPVQVQYTPEVAAARAQHISLLNQEHLRVNNYPIFYASQPGIQYIVPGPQYHPDYLPYAAL